VEPPSARPWLGVGAALSALPAAGGCFCAALALAVIADSDPGAVYEQHRWLGAVVSASAVCAFVAMMGWATLRHGGLPLPVLLMALVVAGLPFLLPRALFLPAAALAVAGCAVLATTGLAHSPASPDATRLSIMALGGVALVLAGAQAVGVGLVGAAPPAPRAQVLVDAPHAAPHHPVSPPDAREAAPAPARHTNSSGTGHTAQGGNDAALPAGNDASSPARPGGTDAAQLPETPSSAGAAPRMPAPADAPAPTPQPAAVGAPAPVELAPDPVVAAGRTFVREYYEAINARRFDVAWGMLAPEVQAAFGGFGVWRQGYARTVSNSAGGVTVTADGTEASVGLTLRAGDRGPCGKTVERRFVVTWRLARTDAGWRATAASGRKLSGPEPC
jgi:hypothetical protein